MIHHFGICLRRVGVLVLVGIAVLSGCRRHEADGRLARVAGIVSAQPEEALRMLGAVDRDSLREADRHYYDLLSVKAADKAYITHMSDSTVLDVINYYASHGPDSLRAESLYYGGRVYSDMGDYPTSLRYFQSALDMLPEDTPYLTLRANVLSQTGRMLNTLRLYERAIPYIEESIRVDSVLNDSLGLMFDTQLLGTVYIKERKYDIAEAKFSFSKEIAKKISPADEYLQTMFLGGIKYRKGKMDSTLQILCPIIDKLHPIDRNNALVFLAKAYLRIGILDSAYLYGKELAFGSKSYNKATGFEILLSPELKNFIPADSLYIYITKYRGVLEHSLNQNGSQEALMQNALYNYQIHEREKEKAEIGKAVLQKWIVGILFLVLVLMIVILYLRNRDARSQLQLREALDNIKDLRRSLDSKQNKEAQAPSDISESDLTDGSSVDLRERLKRELMELQANSNRQPGIASLLLLSKAYATLQDFIREEKVIVESSGLWAELEQAVVATSPDFRYRLQLLIGGNLKASDYHMALLIKCGVTPTQMTKLVGKAKGTISYRREALCIKIFGEKKGVKIVDDVIRLL